MLNQAVAREDNPAAQVADAASAVPITGLKTHRVQHKVYVEVETNRKVTGWGEVSALVPAAAEELAKALFALIDGENPTRIEHLLQKMYRAHRDMRGGPFMSHTVAGIDAVAASMT
jgi:galactonate dehydratase